MTPNVIKRILAHPTAFGLPPDVVSAAPVTGGVVHEVWRIDSKEHSFFVKLRSTQLALVPNIPCNPEDVRHEELALRAFANIAPDFFPQVLYCYPKQGVLILTDVVKRGVILEDILLNGTADPELTQRLGCTLRMLHDRGQSAEPIRAEGEEVFARTKLEHKLGPAEHPAGCSFIERLLTNRRLIIGDPSPKNIAYHAHEKSFTFFDLEDAHIGHPASDVGFLAGHFLLHGYLDPAAARGYLDAFFFGYGSHSFDDLAQFVAAATFHYRLNSIIPYCVTPSEGDRRRLLRGASRAMDVVARAAVSWGEVVEILLGLEPKTSDIRP